MNILIGFLAIYGAFSLILTLIALFCSLRIERDEDNE